MKTRFKPKYFFWFKIILLLLILYLGEASNIVCLLQPQYSPIGRNGLHGSGEIYFIPLETFPAAVLKRFVSFYRNRYGLNISILPALALPRSAFNEERRQFVAEELIEFLQGWLRVTTRSWFDDHRLDGSGYVHPKV